MTATARVLDLALDPRRDRHHGVFDYESLDPMGPTLRLIDTGLIDTGLIDTGLVPPVRDLARVEARRRRRFLALLAATVVVVVASHLAGFSFTGFGTAGMATDQTVPVVHVVAPGDSYGSIAAALGLDQPAAQQLRAANGGGELVVGQRLVFSRDRIEASGQQSPLP